MEILSNRKCMAFLGSEVQREGAFLEVLSSLKNLDMKQIRNELRVFDFSSGKEFEVDWRGDLGDVIERYRTKFQESAPAASGPGRPKLGVTSKPLTLLPKHWEWLALQPGGGSATVRALIDEAMKTADTAVMPEQAKETTYKFMTVIAGDLPHYEEALRALYKNDGSLFELLISKWPKGVQKHVKRLAQGAFDGKPARLK